MLAGHFALGLGLKSRYPSVPLAGDITENVLMVSNTEFGILAASAGITPVAGDGFIGIVVKNCQGTPIAGAKVTSSMVAVALGG